MPTDVDFPRLRQLIDRGAQVIEVLPPEAYEEEHIPGAVNVPLKQLDETAVRLLDESRPVVAYCQDSL